MLRAGASALDNGAVSRRSGTAGHAVLLALSAALVVATPPAATAQAAAPSLSISVPAAASLGSLPVGARTATAQLGPIKVTTGAALAGTGSWTATVSTAGFGLVGSTGTSSATATVGTEPLPGTTIPASSVSYSPGLATTTGVLSTACTAGPAGDLAGSRVAYSCTGFSVLTSTSVTWNPTLSVRISEANVSGSYSGQVTHSVA